ncbi:MAG TPA: sigma-54 factor interaction domain-containing protein [Candidatus Eubacterium pullicola]|nr:sigma-54 factor interaction domain-containing protein [Candidatus Eubacterium pullicola]
MTYEQTTRVGKTILNTTTPVLDENDEILFIVENCRDITEINKLKQDLYDTSKKLMNAQKNLDMRYGDNFKEDIEFTSAKMQEVNNLVDNMAKKDVTMLVLGKSGTGKSMLAKRIHAMSNRSEKPFISINCSTIPENLMESELFGYEKGAFTGASDKGKKGLVENADGGTLFLDEIGEIPMSVQAKLLEFIQEKTFVPVGGTRSRKLMSEL